MKKILTKFRRLSEKRSTTVRKEKGSTYAILGASILGSLLIIMTFVFFVTKSPTPHVSELAFTEYSTLGKSSGSVIPASCESGYIHSADPCECNTTPGQCGNPSTPSGCSTYSGTRADSCPSGWSGVNTWDDWYQTCNGGSGVYLYSTQNTYSCTAPTCSNYILGTRADSCPSGWSGVNTWDDWYSTCGGYQYSTQNTYSCTAPASCTTSWIPGSTSCSAYYPGYSGNITYDYDSCNSSNIQNLDLSSCTPPAAGDCSLPWGGVISNGNSVTAYQTASVPMGNSCVSENRTCTSGSLGGTYTNQSCSVASGAPCTGVNTSGACSYSVSNLASGSSVSTPNTTSGYTGSATISCTNGSQFISNPTCIVSSGTLSGTLSSSALTCTISTGASTCSTDLTWTTSNPVGTSAVTKNNPSATVFTGNNGGPSTAFSTGVTPTTFYLYNSAVELASVVITPTCASSGSWDLVSGACRNPSVTSIIPVGQYYGPGSINFTCSNSNYYILRNTDTNTIVSQGAYTVPLSITVPSGSGSSANYGVTCSYGTVTSPSSVVYYNSPPPPAPRSSISASTASINAKNTPVVLNWTIQYPTNSCTLIAHPVCTKNICTAAQTAAAAALNVSLSQNTDLNDPNGSRPIATALSTIIAGDPDYKARGKKTLLLSSTMDFTIDCGSGNSINSRIRYTTSVEQ